MVHRLDRFGCLRRLAIDVESAGINNVDQSSED